MNFSYINKNKQTDPLNKIKTPQIILQNLDKKTKLYLLGLEASDVWLLIVNDLRLPEVLTLVVNFCEKTGLIEFLNDKRFGAPATVAAVLYDSFIDDEIDCKEAVVAAIDFFFYFFFW